MRTQPGCTYAVLDEGDGDCYQKGDVICNAQLATRKSVREFLARMPQECSLRAFMQGITPHYFGDAIPYGMFPESILNRMHAMCVADYKLCGVGRIVVIRPLKPSQRSPIPIKPLFNQPLPLP